MSHAPEDIDGSFIRAISARINHTGIIDMTATLAGGRGRAADEVAQWLLNCIAEQRFLPSRLDQIPDIPHLWFSIRHPESVPEELRLVTILGSIAFLSRQHRGGVILSGSDALLIAMVDSCAKLSHANLAVTHEAVRYVHCLLPTYHSAAFLQAIITLLYKSLANAEWEEARKLAQEELASYPRSADINDIVRLSTAEEGFLQVASFIDFNADGWRKGQEDRPSA